MRLTHPLCERKRQCFEKVVRKGSLRLRTDKGHRVPSAQPCSAFLKGYRNCSRYHPPVEHVPVLGLILALVLGLVSLALVARLPQRDVPPGLTWLPITLLLYNLWVAGFLITNYLQDRVLPVPSRLAPPLGDAWALALLALALAWLYAHVAQLHAFLGADPTRRARRIARYVFAGLSVVLISSWIVSAWSASDAFLRVVVALTGAAVFPAALVASLWFVFRSRRLRDAAWRRRLSGLGVAYVALFGGLFVLSILWSRLAAVSRGLPVALDAFLELLYNVVAIAWVVQLTGWLGETTPAAVSRVAPPPIDRPQLLARAGITRREAEIVDLICLGKTNQEIADQLFISVTTVKDHNYVIFQKLGVRNRTELTRTVLEASQPPPK